MTNKKVKLAYITNDVARKTTLEKRKAALIKKANELRTLCNVDACAIIYNSGENEPEVWPSYLGAQHVIAKFRRMPEFEQRQKMVNQQSFSREGLTKIENQLAKKQKENQHKELTKLMYGCLVGRGIHSLNFIDSRELGSLLNQNIREVARSVEFLKKDSLLNA